MTITQIQKGDELVSRLTACPYCDSDLTNAKPPAHLPCDETPTTDEVIAALNALGIRP